MFCTKCGTELQSSDKYCSKCGQEKSMPITIEEASAPGFSEQQKSIWNPNAAANWSIIFTPAFGSYMQAINWRVLGEPAKENSAKIWFYFSIAMLCIYIFMGAFMENKEIANSAARGMGFLYLLVWYFSAGRAQAKYVKEKFGSSYQRRAWGKPLLVGMAGIIGLFMCAVTIGVVVAQLNGTVSESEQMTSQEVQNELIQGLETAAKEINKNGPIMVDKGTRLDRAVVGAGARVTYHYTLVEFSAREVDANWLQNNVKPAVKTSVCGNKDMATSLEYGATYIYSYAGKDGEPITSFEINNSDCK